MRLFISLDFNNKIKDYLKEVQYIVKTCAQKGNYTKYDNFHLTLRFLGEVSENEVTKICDILDIVQKKVKRFTINIGDIKSFYRKDKHIVYVDIIKNKTKLYNLAKTLNTFVDEVIPIKQKYKFKPHITIAREVVFKKTSSLTQINDFDEDILVKSISLIKSSRDKYRGLIYTPIYTINLCNK